VSTPSSSFSESVRPWTRLSSISSDHSSAIFSDPVLAEQITYVHELPSRKAICANPASPLHPLLSERLKELGLATLYKHQAEAYDAWVAGQDVVVTTGTNSGKTLCYNLPALQLCLTEPAARCLYLFPTKALAQDQLLRLQQLNPAPNIGIDSYDGDTPKSHRSLIRRNAHIVLTNPDMLHIGILPGHDAWAKFLRSLRLIVIDEMHVYRGVFGSHVGCVLRRLLRLCEWHRSFPQIIACSATIGNPGELFGKLVGRDGRIVDVDGSPSGRRTFVFWTPPQIGVGKRMSANTVSAEILVSLAKIGQRTLTFSRSRIGAELVLRYARSRAEESGGVKPESIESYRAGYTVKERRSIEKGLFDGKLLGLSATNAMELGVDVGSLDAVVMNGYPGTASSYWQQSGRAGRGSKDGLAIMVAHEDPLEHYLARNPSLLLESQNESVSINPENRQVLSGHLQFAAQERPISPSELTRFGESALELAESLDRSGELQFQSGYFYYPSYEPPAPKVNLRGSSADGVLLQVDGVELGSMERWRAMINAHTGAVYLHRGATYLVDELDLDESVARLHPERVDFYTQALSQSVLDPGPAIHTMAVGPATISFCGVKVTDLVTEFQRKSLDGDTVLSVEPLDLPPITYETECVRIDLPELDLSKDVFAAVGAVHGVEHLIMAIAPLLAGCDRGDLGSAWYATFPDTLRPAIFVFDRTPGGVGLCESLFRKGAAWFKAALQLLTSCDCIEGCPSCLLSPRCESSNENLHKSEAAKLLRKLLELEPDPGRGLTR